MVFLGGSVSKESACNAGDLGSILDWENPLEKEMAIHSSTDNGVTDNGVTDNGVTRSQTGLSD